MQHSLLFRLALASLSRRRYTTREERVQVTAVTIRSRDLSALLYT